MTTDVPSTSRSSRDRSRDRKRSGSRRRSSPDQSSGAGGPSSGSSGTSSRDRTRGAGGSPRGFERKSEPSSSRRHHHHRSRDDRPSTSGRRRIQSHSHRHARPHRRHFSGSSHSRGSHKSKVPDLWEQVTPMGTVIAGCFVPMKVPLDHKYDYAIPLVDRWDPSTFAQESDRQQLDIKLVVDLTNTDRYYNGREHFQDKLGIQYIKLPIQGFQQCPTDQNVSAFFDIIQTFRQAFPSSHVAVHCTHGLNRTGYLIVRYLLHYIETETMTVTTALNMFQESRAPGLIKYSYVEELYRRFGRQDEAIQYPELPPWAQEKYSKA